MTPIEEVLKFLRDDLAADMAKIQRSVDSVGSAVTTLTNQVTGLSVESSAHQREDARRFDQLDRRIEKLDTNFEDSGAHEVAAIRAQLAEAKGELKERDSTAAKEKRAFIGKIVAGVLLVIASAAASHVVSRLSVPPAASAGASK